MSSAPSQIRSIKGNNHCLYFSLNTTRNRGIVQFADVVCAFPGLYSFIYFIYTTQCPGMLTCLDFDIGRLHYNYGPDLKQFAPAGHLLYFLYCN